MVKQQYGLIFERDKSPQHPAGEEPYGNFKDDKWKLTGFSSLDGVLKFLDAGKHFAMEHRYDRAKIYELDDDQTAKEGPVKVLELGWYEK